MPKNTNALYENEFLNKGEVLISPNNNYFIWLFDDANLCIFQGNCTVNPDGSVKPDLNASHKCLGKKDGKTDQTADTPHFIKMYESGKLCCERGTIDNPTTSVHTVWSEGDDDYGNGKHYLELDNDGLLGIYRVTYNKRGEVIEYKRLHDVLKI